MTLSAPSAPGGPAEDFARAAAARSFRLADQVTMLARENVVLRNENARLRTEVAAARRSRLVECAAGLLMASRQVDADAARRIIEQAALGRERPVSEVAVGIIFAHEEALGRGA